MNQIKSNLKLYRHYKNKPYKYICEVRHSETLGELVLYETRYENKLGSLWVRPKEMFFENVELNGVFRPRFEQIELRIETSEIITPQNKEQITGLLRLVFGAYKPEKLDSKLKDKKKVWLINAYDDQKLVGFKLGYQLSQTTFYSWLGAIDPEYQGIGLGKKLLDLQHVWCSENGYEVIETKTMNKWKTMLLLNIKNGFEITRTERNQRGEMKILMEKKLFKKPF